jgi:cellulose synthase operon protein C
LLASCYEHLDEQDQRLAACERAVKLDPARSDAQVAMAMALAANGNVASALSVLQRELTQQRQVKASEETQRQIEQSIAQLLLLKTMRLPKAERQNQWKAIETHLENAKGNSVKTTLLRAQFDAAQGNVEKARDKLQNALRDNASKQDAEKLMQDATQLDLWIGLIGLDEQTTKPDDVLQDVDAARKELGDHVELDLALTRHWAGQKPPLPDGALNELEKSAIRYKPDERARLLAALAETHKRADRPKDAERLWKEVAQLRDDDLHCRLALLELTLAKREENPETTKAHALSLVDKIKGIEGEEGTWWRYERAAVLFFLAKDEPNSNAWAEAERFLAEAAQRRPTWARIPRLQAQIAEGRENGDRAIEFYQKAVDLGERDGRTIVALVKLLNAKHRLAEAQAALRKVEDSDAGLSSDLSKIGTMIAEKNLDKRRARELALKAVPPDSKDYREQIWLAFRLASLEDQAGGQIALERAHTLEPNAPEVLIAQVSFYSKFNIDPKNKANLDKALAEAESKLTDNSLALAQCYELVGRNEDAAKQCEAALKTNPNDVPTLRGVATFYQQHQQPLQGEPLLRRVLDQKAASAADKEWARRLLAISLASRGNEQQVREATDRINENLTARPDSIEDLQAKVLIVAAQPGKLPQAIDLLEKLPRLSPEVRFTLAKLYDAAKNWQSAKDQMTALIAEEPDNVVYLAAYINGLIVHNELDEAEKLLGRLDVLQARSLQNLELRVRLLKAQEKTLDAANLIKDRTREKDAPLAVLASLMESLGEMKAAGDILETLASNPKKPDDVLRYALFLGRVHRVADGLRICEQARKNASPEAVGIVSISLLRDKAATEGQREDVEVWLKSVLAKTQTVSLLALWAELQDVRGRYAEAEKAWRAVLQKDQYHAVALNNLACLLAYRLEKGDESLTLINRALAVAGQAPELLDSRALVYLSRDEPDNAITDLKIAVQRGSSGSKYYHLARAYDLAKMPKEAKEAKVAVEALHALEADEFNQFKAKMEK